jgi:transcription-repair coupling factor (superfamily II helicase)
LREWKGLSIEYIIDKIGKSRQFSKAVQDLERITDHVSMTGISGSRSALWAAAIEAAGHPVLIITSNMTSADQIYQDLKELKEGVCLFRPLQPVLYNPLAHSIEAEQSRIMVLDAIAGQRARIVVASAEALLFPIMPIERYQRSRCSLKIGQRVDIAELGQRLISSGYVREDMVEGPGQFSVRGGIVDIFSMGGNPYRIELFDDEIDTIRLVDISTQRSVEKLAKAEILPAVSLLPGRRDIVVMLQNIEADLVRTRERLKSAGIKKLADQLEAEVTMVKQ